jgi:hypothetical protein
VGIVITRDSSIRRGIERVNSKFKRQKSKLKVKSF